jgi:hypothetical protein
LKAYFNCSSDLPEIHTKENGAMTRLIEQCLTHVPLDSLFAFKFALIDAPGPIYDGFLGEDSLIDARSPQQMLLKSDLVGSLDVLTGINKVEGFSFEGYFSSSVDYWIKLNVTNELMLTTERFSLLSRDKCLQHSYIDNRNRFNEYYDAKLKTFINTDKLRTKEVLRLKGIFLNSDAIFDSGFIEFLTLLQKKRQSETGGGGGKKLGGMFVYEYLHENYGSQVNFKSFKEFLRENQSMSTHFDGIDLIFGNCIPIKLNLFNFTEITSNNFVTSKDCHWSTVTIIRTRAQKMIRTTTRLVASYSIIVTIHWT